MDNIFTTLRGLSTPQKTTAARDKTQPKPPEPAAQDYMGMPVQKLVSEWQKSATPELTSAVLKRMQPTIDAAITSYAPGMEGQLSVKAAKLTLQALKTYDPSYGTNPGTHVFHNLKRLSRLGTQASSIIPQPEGLLAEKKRVTDIMDKFEDRKGREPSMAELADLTGISVKRLDTVLKPNMVLAESSTLSEDSQRDTVSQSDMTDKDYYEYVYSSVGPVDQKIMEWTSGLHGGKVLSNNAIAAKLRISPAAVSQRKAKIQMMMSDVRSVL